MRIEEPVVRLNARRDAGEETGGWCSETKVEVGNNRQTTRTSQDPVSECRSELRKGECTNILLVSVP